MQASEAIRRQTQRWRREYGTGTITQKEGWPRGPFLHELQDKAVQRASRMDHGLADQVFARQPEYHSDELLAAMCALKRHSDTYSDLL